MWCFISCWYLRLHIFIPPWCLTQKKFRKTSSAPEDLFPASVRARQPRGISHASLTELLWSARFSLGVLPFFLKSFSNRLGLLRLLLGVRGCLLWCRWSWRR